MKNNDERIACLRAAGKQQPALQSVHASGEIHGLLLRMKLRQHYKNNSKSELETVYSFPLAWGTTLLAMRVTLNGKEMTGAVIEKKEAEEKYEDAISAGDLPVMLVKEGKDLYSARLGNLKPGDEASIEIEYGQLLKPDQGQLRFSLPTTIAPRFGRDPGLRGLVSHAIGAVDPLAEYRFFLSIDIRGALAQGKIHSPSHQVSQQAHADGVRIELARKAMLDRDFVLCFDGTGQMRSVIASAEPDGGEGCTLLASFVPVPDATSEANRPLRLKMLLDCSGSMAGDSMRLAREALQEAIEHLRADDRASLSRFGSRVVHMRRQMIAVDEYGAASMQHWLLASDANMGGTELREAMEQVISIPSKFTEGEQGAGILLITDGDVWDIDAIVATARTSGHRVFALGVGSSPAESLLKELAEVTNGACELVAPGEDMAAAVMRLMRKMRSASTLEIGAEFDASAVELPALTRAVAPGEMVSVWCQLPHRPVNAPKIRVSWVGSTAMQRVDTGSITWDETGTVARIGAAQRLLDIADERQRKEIALRYQLLTEQTSFFLAHERAALDKASGVPELQQIDSMMAAGWGGAGTVHACVSFDMAEPSMHAFDSPSYCRKSVEFQPVRTPAVWRRESASDSVKAMEREPYRLYSSLAQMVANHDEADNPLRIILADVKQAGGDFSVLLVIAARIESEPQMKILRELLDGIGVRIGNSSAALAVLLDWSVLHFTDMGISRRSFRPVAALVSTLEPEVLAQAIDYLDAEAAQAPPPLPKEFKPTYDIPAFLRTSAD